MSEHIELKRLAEAVRDSDIDWEPNQKSYDYFQALRDPRVVLALIAENEALRKDAERYRWLIRNAEEIYFSGVNLHLDPFYAGHEKIKEGADSDIDAAMQKGSQP